MTKEQQQLLADIMQYANEQMSNPWKQDDKHWMEAHEAYSICDWIDEKIEQAKDSFSEVHNNVFGFWSFDEAKKLMSDYESKIAALRELKTIMEGK